MASKKPAPPTKIVLPATALSAISQRQTIIDQYKYLLSCMEMERDMLVLNLTGVDVRTGEWSLDMQQGVLERHAGNN